jgi:hypothetical protein
MAEQNGWTWKGWYEAGRVIGRWVAASLILVLKSPFLAVRAAHPWAKRAEPWGILIAVLAFTCAATSRSKLAIVPNSGSIPT